MRPAGDGTIWGRWFDGAPRRLRVLILLEEARRRVRHVARVVLDRETAAAGRAVVQVGDEMLVLLEVLRQLVDVRRVRALRGRLPPRYSSLLLCTPLVTPRYSSLLLVTPRYSSLLPSLLLGTRPYASSPDVAARCLTMRHSTLPCVPVRCRALLCVAFRSRPLPWGKRTPRRGRRGYPQVASPRSARRRSAAMQAARGSHGEGHAVRPRARARRYIRYMRYTRRGSRNETTCTRLAVEVLDLLPLDATRGYILEPDATYRDTPGC